MLLALVFHKLELGIRESNYRVSSGVAAALVLPNTMPLALPLCHEPECRSCRDGQLLLEEQK